MIEKVTPKQLYINLWRKGPYLVYFNGENKEIDKDAITVINEMAKWAIFVQVLEVNWENYVRYDAKVNPDQLKKVTVYYENEIKKSIIYPSFNQIFELFELCRYLFSQKIQKTNLKFKNKNDNLEKNVLNKKNVRIRKWTYEQLERRAITSRIYYRNRLHSNKQSILNKNVLNVQPFIITQSNNFYAYQAPINLIINNRTTTNINQFK